MADTVRSVDDQIQPAPDAALGRSDETRRWAIRDARGQLLFPGLTRPEAAGALTTLPADSWEDYLVAVTLPVLLTDGAGPHLVDVRGNLVLAVADHPRLAACKLALGPEGGRERIGLVAQHSSAVWRWAAQAVLDPAHRVPALDALEDLKTRADIEGWLRDAAAWV